MAGSVQMIPSGVYEMERSAEMMAECVKVADKICAAAGRGFETQEWTGKHRARVTVRTATMSARVRDAREHILARSLDAGRG